MKIFLQFSFLKQRVEKTHLFFSAMHIAMLQHTIGQVESRHIPGFSCISSYGSWEVAFSPDTRLFHSSMEFHGGLQFLVCFAKLQL